MVHVAFRGCSMETDIECDDWLRLSDEQVINVQRSTLGVSLVARDIDVQCTSKILVLQEIQGRALRFLVNEAAMP